MEYKTHTLDNGLRVIHLPSRSQIVYCGYQIAAGTRNEQPGEEGLAHFVEHVTFKGTQRRNSLQIINALESVGGELNAYTNKEDTTYYAVLLKEHLPRAIDLLTDIVFHSTYPSAEIEKEKEVIVEEIESYNDSPAELIYDEFENTIFKGHPLGHNILGSIENVRAFTSADAARFAKRFYRPDNAVFFIYGDVEFNKLVRLLSKCDIPKEHQQEDPIVKQIPVSSTGMREEERYEDDEKNAGWSVIDRKTHQAHVMLGTKGYGMHHPDRIALYLLNNILGGPSLNARLSLSLREHHGLVYTVESTMATYTDTGIWSVYFGCDHSDIKKCLRLVRKELDKVQKKPISSTQLKRAKQQIKGQLGIACDNRESFALDLGKTFLHYNEEKDLQRLYELIDAVSAEQLQHVAQELFDEKRLFTLIYK